MHQELTTSTSSARLGQWNRKEGHGKERIIIFIVGGCTFSEMRVAYEVTNSNERKNWEVVIGGTQLLTPHKFLQHLKELS